MMSGCSDRATNKTYTKSGFSSESTIRMRARLFISWTGPQSSQGFSPKCRSENTVSLNVPSLLKLIRGLLGYGFKASNFSISKYLVNPGGSGSAGILRVVRTRGNWDGEYFYTNEEYHREEHGTQRIHDIHCSSRLRCCDRMVVRKYWGMRWVRSLLLPTHIIYRHKKRVRASADFVIPYGTKVPVRRDEIRKGMRSWGQKWWSSPGPYSMCFTYHGGARARSIQLRQLSNRVDLSDYLQVSPWVSQQLCPLSLGSFCFYLSLG